MAILNYIIWNGSPEIFSAGTFALRWYGLFFALGFLISQQILYYMYRQEGKPEKDVDTLTIYMVVATIIGARLGHVLFYQPEIIWQDPIGIFLPFEFSPFRFTGLQGLASHGGAIGILFALWVYSRYRISFSKVDVELKGEIGKEGKVRKKARRGFFVERIHKPGQSYFQVLDRIVILVALTGALIRVGNYFNSEIIGKPTDAATGVVFVNRFTESLEERKTANGPVVESVAYQKYDSIAVPANGRVPMGVYLFFAPSVTEEQAYNFIEFSVKDMLTNRLYEYFDESDEQIQFTIVPEEDGSFAAKIETLGIVRHPAQLYEAISCVILFLALFAIWSKYKQNLPAGRLFGIFLIVCFGLRFLYEYLKEPQESFENDLPLFMGQILSIPLVIAGIFVLVYSFRNKKVPDNALR
jgi:phosphatidylglycerol---prolipoprotein diacylglyceryl transferase